MVHWEVGRDEVRSLPRQVDNGKVLDEPELKRALGIEQTSRTILGRKKPPV
jgi:hypothetical protein